MTNWLVSRHLGAIEWIQLQGIKIDKQVEHLDISQVKAGDLVVGTLPIQLAAEVCARKAKYLHLCLDMPQTLRGKELDCETLIELGAKLKEFKISFIEG